MRLELEERMGSRNGMQVFKFWIAGYLPRRWGDGKEVRVVRWEISLRDACSLTRQYWPAPRFGVAVFTWPKA